MADHDDRGDEQPPRRPTINGPHEPVGLTAIRPSPYQKLPLGDGLAWLDELVGGLVVGGVYLFAGAPGGGKSRLSTQIALAAGLAGVRSMIVMTEEKEERLLCRAQLLTADWSAADADRALRHVESTAEVSDLADLPYFLNFNVTHPKAAYRDVKLLILDSVQGDGLAPNAARKYESFYRFCRSAKSHGVTIIAVGHVNKRGQLAGPRGLEHFVDAVVRIEKVGTGRLIAVPKNRFAPELPAGLPLVTDPATSALRPSPHRAPLTGIARTFVGGGEAGDAELQVQLSLPMPGQRPQITAPGLPRRRVEQVVRAVTSVPSLGLDALDLNINALLPGDGGFRSWHGLPLAISLAASVMRQPVPPTNVYVGEVDLNRVIRPLPTAVVDSLIDAVGAGRLARTSRLMLPPETATQLGGLGLSLVCCGTLDQAVLATWENLR